MGTNLSPVGSSSPILEFMIGGNPVELFPKYFKKMVILERATTGSSYAFFKFFDDRWTMLEDLFLDSKDKVSFRYGWVDSEVSKWKNMVVAVYDLEYTLDGAILYLWLMDQSMLSSGGLSRSFGTVKISEIVQQIAIESNMEYVIEPTKGEYSFRQNNVYSIDFIKNWLLPRAISEKTGRGDYRFYIKDGKELHFHTPDYSKVVYKTYKIFNEGDHVVNSFRFRTNFRTMFGTGANRELHVQGYDPINKTELDSIVTDESTPEKVRLGRRMPVHTTSAGGSKFIGVPFKTQAQVEQMAKQLWYEYDLEQITARMKMLCDPGLEPGRLVDIALQNDYTGGLANGSGRYLVNNIVTTMSLAPLKFSSIVLLGRNAMTIGQTEVSGVEPKATIYESELTDIDNSSTDEVSQTIRQFGSGQRRVKEASPVG